MKKLVVKSLRAIFTKSGPVTVWDAIVVILCLGCACAVFGIVDACAKAIWG